MFSRTVNTIKVIVIPSNRLSLQQILIAGASKMPKKKPSSKGVEPAPSIADKLPIVLGKGGEISISIQVKPGAKTDAITDVSDTAVGVQISAPPVDGEANTAIVKYFAELLKVKKTDVSLKGGKSRQKTILVAPTASLTVDGVLALLKAEQQQR